jgi:putative FmdB family regulatory protein
MPLFEYVCSQCGHLFEALVFAGKRPDCPKCGGKNLEQAYSTFAVSQGSGGSRAAASSAGPSCGPSGGS